MFNAITAGVDAAKFCDKNLSNWLRQVRYCCLQSSTHALFLLPIRQVCLYVSVNVVIYGYLVRLACSMRVCQPCEQIHAPSNVQEGNLIRDRPIGGRWPSERIIRRGVWCMAFDGKSFARRRALRMRLYNCARPFIGERVLICTFTMVDVHVLYSLDKGDRAPKTNGLTSFNYWSIRRMTRRVCLWLNLGDTSGEISHSKRFSFDEKRSDVAAQHEHMTWASCEGKSMRDRRFIDILVNAFDTMSGF